MVIVAIVIVALIAALFFALLSLSGLVDSSSSDVYPCPKSEPTDQASPTALKHARR